MLRPVVLILQQCDYRFALLIPDTMNKVPESVGSPYAFSTYVLIYRFSRTHLCVFLIPVLQLLSQSDSFLCCVCFPLLAPMDEPDSQETRSFVPSANIQLPSGIV